MREQRNFSKRTQALASGETKKKYFLIYEGEKTEKIYFDAIHQNRIKIGINPLIELIPLLRSDSERGKSHPDKILDMVFDIIEEQRSGEITCQRLCDWITDYFIDERLLNCRDKIREILNQICQSDLQLEANDYITKDCVEEKCKLVVSKFSEKMSIPNAIEYVRDIIDSGHFTYDAEIDKICIVVDRDKDSFTESQYDSVLRVCHKNHFGFYITNPCFEFWLLMHFDEVCELDAVKLLENPFGPSERRYTEQQLRNILKGYEKSKYDTDILILNTDKAIETEKQFCEDEEQLKYKIGSNVGLLIEEMRAKY